MSRKSSEVLAVGTSTGTPVPDTKSSKIVTLAVCIVGIYCSFITWSVLQEKISTTGYGPQNHIFQLPLVVNVIQASFACVTGSIYLSWKLNKATTPFHIFYNTKTQRLNTVLLKYFFVISLTQSISSPIGMLSLNHVNYLIFLLAKSCKLIPVMMVQFLVFGKKFPAHKYAVALFITSGVSMFTICKTSTKNGAQANDDGNMVLGLSYLLVSMFLDGLTNSTQDQLFKLQMPDLKITGAHLMSGLNLLNALITLTYALLATDQISYAVNFIRLYPELLYNVLLFGIFGALGQIFIFVTLENFDSIVLVTVTVTRKMFSMLLSVVIFGHVLNWKQWVGVSLVFGGIGWEAWLKNGKKSKTE